MNKDIIDLPTHPANGARFTGTLLTILIAAGVLTLKWQQHLLARQDQQLGPDLAVESYTERLAPLKADLGLKVPRLGYEQPEEPGQPVPRTEAWTICQYIMAPITVSLENQNEQLILIDCMSPQQLAQTMQRNDIQIIKNYDRGLLLVTPKGVAPKGPQQ